MTELNQNNDARTILTKEEKAKIRRKNYYLNNKSKILAKQKEYYQNNKQVCIQRSKKTYQKHLNENELEFKAKKNKQSRKSYFKNKEKNKKKKEQLVLTDPELAKSQKEKQNAYSKNWRTKNKNLVKEINKRYTENNPEKVKQSQKQYYENNKADIISRSRQDYLINKEERTQTKRKWRRERLLRDELYAAKTKLRRAVSTAFARIRENKPASTQALLGCSYEEAKKHIEGLFKPGMSWLNHGDLWQIDHIRPVSSFTTEDLHLMNLITNLQPLWTKDNILKRDKYES